jgi:hypothetical protein
MSEGEPLPFWILGSGPEEALPIDVRVKAAGLTAEKLQQLRSALAAFADDPPVTLERYELPAGTRVNRPAASMRGTFRETAGVSTHGSPPGAYWYQIGKVSGPRSWPADTERAAICGSARNSCGRVQTACYPS